MRWKLNSESTSRLLNTNWIFTDHKKRKYNLFIKAHQLPGVYTENLNLDFSGVPGAQGPVFCMDMIEISVPYIYYLIEIEEHHQITVN